MKIVILTGKFGMGHLKAAEAIKEELTVLSVSKFTGVSYAQQDIENIEIVDWVEYLSPLCAKYIYGGYSRMIRCSMAFYNLHYKSSEKRPTDQKPSRAFASYMKMNRLISEKQPDLIISVLADASKAVSYYKALSGSPIPLVTCITDITGHPEWINRHTNAYAVGSEEVRRSLIKRGVPENRIYVTGIPVRQGFAPADSSENMQKSHSASEAGKNNRPKVLLMGGGLGLLPKGLDFYKKLSDSVPADITLITGKNEKLFQRLHHRFNNIEVLGYVQDIEKYFLRSDLVVTKPGGITTFEAICTETPILALNPIMRQEKYNAAFITRHQLGQTLILEDSAAAIEEMAALIRDTSRIEHYKSQMAAMKRSLETCSLINVINEAAVDIPSGGGLHHEIFSFNF